MKAGNREIIGIRHRESQTLFITDIIDLDKKKRSYSYGHLQTGLWISALLDVLLRAQDCFRTPSKSPVLQLSPPDISITSTDTSEHNNRGIESGKVSRKNDPLGGRAGVRTLLPPDDLRVSRDALVDLVCGHG